MMTQDNIIRMALEADCYKTETGALITDNVDLERFAALVAAHERDACAELMLTLDLCGEEGKAAAAIRARGEK